MLYICKTHTELVLIILGTYPIEFYLGLAVRRILAPAYGDGEFLPRGVLEYTEQGGYSSKLPSARTVSDKEYRTSINSFLTFQLFAEQLSHKSKSD